MSELRNPFHNTLLQFEKIYLKFKLCYQTFMSLHVHVQSLERVNPSQYLSFLFISQCSSFVLNLQFLTASFVITPRQSYLWTRSLTFAIGNVIELDGSLFNRKDGSDADGVELYERSMEMVKTSGFLLSWLFSTASLSSTSSVSKNFQPLPCLHQ